MNSLLRPSVFVLLLAALGCGERLPFDRPPDSAQAEVFRREFEATAGASSAKAGPALVEPTGWATLTGKFTIVGTPTASKPPEVTKDQATCGPGLMHASAKDILIGPGSGIGNVLVMLDMPSMPAGDPKWEHPSYAASKTAVLTQSPFDQKNCVFVTRVYAMRSTQTVPILNSDPVGHNANIQAEGNASPKNISMTGGQEVPYLPGGQSQSPFKVTCTIHPWMTAWMISRNDPYFAVSAPDGAFKIENLPAAEGLKLTFRAWQERSKFIQDVKVNGQSAKWNKGRFQVEMKPGETTNLEVVVDAGVFK